MRRILAPLLLAAFSLPATSAIVPAQTEQLPAVPTVNVATEPASQVVYKSHAIAMHGEPKYPADFKHFDYVNPDAPKGGEIRTAARGTFDSFNRFIAKGTPAGTGSIESLTVSSTDEPFTQYGLLAESIEWPEDRSWVAFTLREEARWHDGMPVTVEDVIFTLETLKTKGHPFYRFYYGSVERAERVGERKVKFVFSEKGNRELPLIVGQLEILPKHYWEDREFDETTLEPPLGSGPYKVSRFEAGRYIIRERVEDYWGKDLPVNVGQNNFDRLRTDFFLDTTVIRQALKSGTIDYRNENQAKAWASAYEVPAVRRGWLQKEQIKHERPTGMQAFVFNMRRQLFQDPLVRQAISYAFDFEWSNPTLFFGQYNRTESYFSNSELASSSLPQDEELEILERYRGRVPDEVFTKTFAAPQTDGQGWPRDNLDKAFRLLSQAGWVVRDLKLVNAETNEQFGFEILLVSPEFERIVLPFKRNLERLGMNIRVRIVDTSQYVDRLRNRDYDMISTGWGQSESPGNEQRDFWGSVAADQAGSRNYTGVKDPVVDELIELVITAPTRESLIQRTRALDRVLLWSHLVVPAWHLQYDRILYWDKFSRPDVTPKRGTSTNYWWYDEAKAAALREARSREARDSRPADSDTPGLTTTVFVFLGLLLVGFFVFRRVMAKPSS
ncbi:ABC transporter substrate-binding protein [Denitrobaculum tricleocarpae]|uniref:ABC transporter substrate-binding protein n=2 Tax=Denitrobaculum tricleocarpae TaxID=2591009 RepID=A0A545U383_9PROT|nr:ABC transporter substrate-binding protein [Denitrobaculum tricleocarpae]